jgi:hypothetical protein
MKDDFLISDTVPKDTAKSIIEKYADNIPIRFLIQKIPFIGGSLDFILSEVANKWREKRFQTLLINLDEKIKAIGISAEDNIAQIQHKVSTEDFYDLFLLTVQKSMMTHKEEKISRFANILKNYLINELTTEDYLVEVFFDITDDLSETEISKLAELQDNSIEVYYTSRDKPFDIERLQKDVSARRIRIDDANPIKYEYDSFYMYYLNRLSRYGLIDIEKGQKYGGYFDIGWKTNNQSASSQLNYFRKDIISISEFGKRFVQWVLA